MTNFKNDPSGALQYGLIAEEVDKVYPELVIRNDAGKIEGVRYDELAPMLLNEVQSQQAQLKQQSDEIKRLTQQVSELNGLKEELHSALRQMQGKTLVAQR